MLWVLGIVVPQSLPTQRFCAHEGIVGFTVGQWGHPVGGQPHWLLDRRSGCWCYLEKTQSVQGIRLLGGECRANLEVFSVATVRSRRDEGQWLLWESPRLARDVSLLVQNQESELQVSM